MERFRIIQIVSVLEICALLSCHSKEDRETRSVERSQDATAKRYAGGADELRAEIQILERKILRLKRENLGLRETLTPQERHIVIDTNDNRLFLKEGDQVLREALCSTGSGRKLDGPRGKQWIFDTPPGVYQVKRKEENPIWIKPEWAFVEKGESIPIFPESFERFQFGVLGEYALDLGDGYKIHGTLYENLLGKSITHGCVRVSSDDLEVLYRSVDVGTKVYIY